MKRGHRTGNKRFVTAEETAGSLQVTLNTVYRWCRSGRLPARKFGGQWRIDSSVLEGFGYPGPKNKPANLLDHILPYLSRDGEHLLALGADEAAALRLQAAFLETALRQPNSVVYLGLWDESPAEATGRLRASLTPETEIAGKLHLLPLGEWYARSSLAGTIAAARAAVARSRKTGERIWTTSYGQRYFGGNVERLVEYEQACCETLAGTPTIAFCIYEHTASRQQLLRVATDLTGVTEIRPSR